VVLQGVAEFWNTCNFPYGYKFLLFVEFFVVPSTSVAELAHWALTVGMGCHWPMVLWLRVPMLMQGAWTFVENVYFGLAGLASEHVRKDIQEQEVEVWTPIDPPAADTPKVCGAPGYWRKTTATVKLSLDKRTFKEGEAKGQMRDVYNLLDVDAKIFADGLSAPKGTFEAKSRELVCKKYVFDASLETLC
jgi:hypothetical protein